MTGGSSPVKSSRFTAGETGARWVRPAARCLRCDWHRFLYTFYSSGDQPAQLTLDFSSFNTNNPTVWGAPGWLVGWLVAKLYLTLCDPMDCSPPGSSVHGTLQTRILEWVAIPFSWASSWPRDGTHVSCIDRWLLYHWAVREAQRPLVLGKPGWLAVLSAEQTGMNILSCHSESLKLTHKREMVVCRKVPLLCWAPCSKLKQLAFCFKFFSIQPFRMKDLSF